MDDGDFEFGAQASACPVWPESRVPVELVRAQCAGAVRAGLTFEHLLTQSFVDPLTAEQQGLTPQQHILLMLNVITCVDDEAHGLARGRLRRGSAALALRTISTCQTLDHAIAVLIRYFELLDPVFRIGLAVERGVARLMLAADDSEGELSAALEEIWLAELCISLSWFVGQRLPMIDMTLRTGHAQTGPSLHWGLQIPVRRGPVTSIRFPASALGWPRAVEEIEEPLWGSLSAWMRPAAVPMTTRPEEIGIASLRMSEMSRRSGVSATTMRRRLQKEGASFRALRNQALVSAGMELLLTTEATLDDIAAELGYAETRSFRRLIKTTTGRTPSQIRADGRVEQVVGPSDRAVKARIHQLVRAFEV